MGIAALSAELGIARSNIHRLLSTLVELGYVRKELETRRYAPTLRIWEQGAQVADRSAVRRVARPVLRQLSLEVGSFVVMSVLSGTDVLYLDKLEATKGNPSESRAGLRVPAIFPATGKAVLAFQPNVDALVAEICETVPQAAVLRPDAILAELADIRTRGYATSINGWTANASSIAVPVRHGSEAPRIAIGVGVNSDKTEIGELEKLAPTLQETANQLAYVLQTLTI